MKFHIYFPVLNYIVFTYGMSTSKIHETFDEEAMQIMSNDIIPIGPVHIHLPYVVSLQENVGRNKYKHLCIGSIIDEEIIMTTAHCLIEHKIAALLSIVGGSNTLDYSDNVIDRHQVVDMVSHDDFWPLQGRDIALLKVRPKFKLDGKHYAKVDFMPELEVDKGDFQAYLIGWGRVNEAIQQNLEAVNFHTITLEQCRSDGFVHATHTELCAIGNKDATRGACDGDSGGPLVDPTFNVQYGLLSYGRTPCEKGVVYAFTYIRPLINWILKTVAMLRKKSISIIHH